MRRELGALESMSFKEFVSDYVEKQNILIICK